jgi:hypothetical protein
VIAIDKELTKQALIPHGIPCRAAASCRALNSSTKTRCRALCAETGL